MLDLRGPGWGQSPQLEKAGRTAGARQRGRTLPGFGTKLAVVENDQILPRLGDDKEPVLVGIAGHIRRDDKRRHRPKMFMVW